VLYHDRGDDIEDAGVEARRERERERESIMICHELNLCLVVMIVIVIVTLNVTRTFSQFCVRTNAQIIHNVLPPR
jgi:hypothetical protein